MNYVIAFILTFQINLMTFQCIARMSFEKTFANYFARFFVGFCSLCSGVIIWDHLT
jgi:hypothetical protein